MTQNDQHALEILKQWMDFTDRYKLLQAKRMEQYLTVVLNSHTFSYNDFSDNTLEEQSALQRQIDRTWKLLERWHQGENILISRLSLDD